MEDYDLIGETKEIGILINGIKYSYLITKSETEEESLIIKLYNPNKISDIYFTYEAPISKLRKDIKFLDLCDNLDEMIISLKDIFYKGNAKVEENHGIFNLELKYIVTGISKKCIIKLIKHDSKNPMSDLEDKINKLENKYNELYNKYEELKTTKEENIRNIVKEVILDKDIKNNLFEEIEQLLLAKYNLNNINKNKDNKVEDNITNKVQNEIENQEENNNNELMNTQNQIKENIEYLNNIKSNINNNFIILQVKINASDINKDIILFNQVSTYKYYCNFERDDIEVIIDNQIVPIKFKSYMREFKCESKSKNNELTQKL